MPKKTCLRGRRIVLPTTTTTNAICRCRCRCHSRQGSTILPPPPSRYTVFPLIFLLLTASLALSPFLWPLHWSIGTSPAPLSGNGSGRRSTSRTPRPGLLNLRRRLDFKRELQRILLLPCGFPNGFRRSGRISFLCDVGVADYWGDTSAGVVSRSSSCRGMRLVFLCFRLRVYRVVGWRSCGLGWRRFGGGELEVRDPSPMVVAEVGYWDCYCRGAVVVSCGFLLLIWSFLVDDVLGCGCGWRVSEERRLLPTT